MKGKKKGPSGIASRRIESRAERSEIMARVKGKDTKPEMEIRRLVFGLGYRFRLHGSSLPGKPDLVFKKKRKVIFIHGCFWHCHSCRAGKNKPKSNTEYWGPKLKRNKLRDHENQKELKKMGWELLVVWECAIRDKNKVKTRVLKFLSK